MTERIFELARNMLGIKDRECPLLETFCHVAELSWKLRIRDDIAFDSYEDVFCCAAALSAAADYVAGNSEEEISAFSVGELSVHLQGGKEKNTTAKTLREMAERLMVPYVKDSLFCFKGVQA